MDQLQANQNPAKRKTHRGSRLPRALRRAAANGLPVATGRAPDGLGSLVAAGTPDATQATPGPPTSAATADPPGDSQVNHPGISQEAAQSASNGSLQPSDVPSVTTRGNGGSAGGVVTTQLFQDKRHIREDARLARRSALENWMPDPKVVAAAKTKVSHAVLSGEMDGQRMSPANTLKGIEMLHGFQRLIVANDHHEDRLEFNERVRGAMPLGTQIGVSVRSGDSATNVGVTVYVPDNERENDGVEPLRLGGV